MKLLVTHTWVVDVPEGTDDPQDWARDCVLNSRPDSESYEEL